MSLRHKCTRKGLAAVVISAFLALFNPVIAQAAAPGEIWIDVRTAEEYQAAHLPGAINIPYEQISTRIAEATVDKNAVIQLYCKSGRRSGIALDTLKQQGYLQVFNAGAFETLQQTQ
jgi:phage shock protein E